MNKNEFLEILKQSLDGEVSSDIIDQSVKYYEEYIGSKPLEEVAILDKLGSPRLIAKTIIESDKASKQKNSFSGYQRKDYGYDSEEQDIDKNYQSNSYESPKISLKLSWSQKIIMTLILIATVIVLIFIGRFIVWFLFAFAVPILLIILLMFLFKKRN